MYHAIVEKKVRALFESVSAGDAGPVLAGFAPRFIHEFLGNSALGGRRHSLTATRQWYERLYRLMPDIAFDVERVSVSGPPWNTLALAQWRESNSGTDGVRTENAGVHVVHIAWGRMTRLIICPDTVGVKETLDRLAAAGIEEAAAPPIED